MASTLHRAAVLTLILTLLVQTTGSAWASVMDCCDDGYAACLSEPMTCAFCAVAVPALLHTGSAGFVPAVVTLSGRHGFAVASSSEAMIWRPPIAALSVV